MQTKPAHPMYVSRLSVAMAFAGFALFLVLVVFVRQSNAPAVQVDLSQIPESDRWKFTVEGREAKLAEFHANERRLAESYGWIDQGKGVVRLPISAAMELTLRDINAAGKR